MHIAPHDNQNQPIVDVGHSLVPLNYFNIVKLTKGELFGYSVQGYETCIVPATGTIKVEVGGQTHTDLGQRRKDTADIRVHRFHQFAIFRERAAIIVE